MEQKQKITKEMKISEVVGRYPKTALVFMDYGFQCMGCPMAQDETVEEAAMAHRLDLNNLLKDLNKVA